VIPGNELILEDKGSYMYTNGEKDLINKRPIRVYALLAGFVWLASLTNCERSSLNV